MRPTIHNIRKQVALYDLEIAPGIWGIWPLDGRYEPFKGVHVCPLGALLCGSAAAPGATCHEAAAAALGRHLEWVYGYTSAVDGVVSVGLPTAEFRAGFRCGVRHSRILFG